MLQLPQTIATSENLSAYQLATCVFERTEGRIREWEINKRKLKSKNGRKGRVENRNPQKQQCKNR